MLPYLKYCNLCLQLHVNYQWFSTYQPHWAFGSGRNRWILKRKEKKKTINMIRVVFYFAVFGKSPQKHSGSRNSSNPVRTPLTSPLKTIRHLIPMSISHVAYQHRHCWKSRPGSVLSRTWKFHGKKAPAILSVVKHQVSRHMILT